MRGILSVLLVAGLVQGQNRAMGAETLALRWSELSGLLVDKRVSIALAGKGRIEGDVVAIRSDAIVMNIFKSSDKQRFGLGQSLIPRSEVRDLKIIRDRVAPKIAGGIMGGAGGLFAGGALAYAADSAALAWVTLFLLTPMAAIGGYYAGKAAGRTTTPVIITAPEEMGVAK